MPSRRRRSRIDRASDDAVTSVVVAMRAKRNHLRVNEAGGENRDLYLCVGAKWGVKNCQAANASIAAARSLATSRPIRATDVLGEGIPSTRRSPSVTLDLYGPQPTLAQFDLDHPGSVAEPISPALATGAGAGRPWGATPRASNRATSSRRPSTQRWWLPARPP